MQQFTDFILTVRYPPNPIRALDNDGTAAQDSGETFFTSTPTDGGNTCQFCHTLPFGTDGFSTFEGETQEFKIAHMRNLYQKVGMFGVPPGVPGIPATGNLGPQVRGFGFLHDGSIATVFDFVNANVFLNLNDTLRRNLEAFALALDTGLRPVVGQQLTVTATTKSAAATLTRWPGRGRSRRARRAGRRRRRLPRLALRHGDEPAPARHAAGVERRRVDAAERPRRRRRTHVHGGAPGRGRACRARSRPRHVARRLGGGARQRPGGSAQ
jgi:hypothetical protein